jgi:acyl-CoA synthetase (AMP-forming)/AMP-acid ligase II
VPQLYELVDTLPRNPSGKLLKPELRKRFPGPAPF